MEEGTTAIITAMTTKFTEAIGGLSTPVQTILGAGVVLIVIFAVYKIGKKAFNKSTS